MRDVFLTGWEFILLGVALGPLGLDLITTEKLEQLDPFIAVGLGWVGLIFGIQMRTEDLLKVDRGILKLTLFQSTAVWAGLYSLFGILLMMVFTVSWSEVFTAACIVGAAGSLSSPTALALMAPRFSRETSGKIRSLLMVANLDLAPAIVAVGIVFCFFPASGSGFDFYGGVILLSYSAIMALAMAGLFRFFGREILTPEEDLAVIIGFLAFVSGVAFYLSLSPLFLSLAVGITLANTLKSDDPIFGVLFATEKPFYVILLILAGLLWSGMGVAAVAVALLVILFRVWLKAKATSIGSRIFLSHNPLPEKAGLALTSQGALALAIGINYLIIYPGPTSKLAFGVIVLSTVVNEIAAPFLIKFVFGGDEEK